MEGRLVLALGLVLAATPAAAQQITLEAGYTRMPGRIGSSRSDQGALLRAGIHTALGSHVLLGVEGAVERAIQINIDAAKLAAYRTSIMQVHDAIVAQNAEVPGGRVDAGFREMSLRTLGRVPASRDFNQLVVSTDAGEGSGELGMLDDVGDRRGRIGDFCMNLDGQPTRMFVLGVVNEAERSIVISCDVVWDNRQIWHQEFHDLVRTLKLK